MGHGSKKKGTAAQKKRLRNKSRQDAIRRGRGDVDLKTEACNQVMECSSCLQRQKNRAFCYFCDQLQPLPQCAECGKTKCMGGDCMVPHAGRHATGMSMVGAVCDYCEAFICHSKKCLQTHACRCPLAEVECVACERGVWEIGGRMFQCATCSEWVCEDDQFEHQASCQVLESETNHCMSCNRLGNWSCLRCKICFCDTHVKSKTMGVLKKGESYKCKKCSFQLQESKMLSMSTRTHDYGRQTRDEQESGYYGRDRATTMGESGIEDGMSNMQIGDYPFSQDVHRDYGDYYDDEEDEADSSEGDGSGSSGGSDQDEEGAEEAKAVGKGAQGGSQ
eukprot:evm.model.scf_638.2 EVM.evm.TU.scf_638.2   scf_638:23522-31216(-)